MRECACAVGAWPHPTCVVLPPQVLLRDLGMLYDLEIAGDDKDTLPQPPELQMTVVEHALWSREYLASPQGARLWQYVPHCMNLCAISSQRVCSCVCVWLRSYWQRQLSGFLPVLALPTDLARPAVLPSKGATHTFAIDADLTARIRAFARSNGATLYMVLLAAFNAVLHRCVVGLRLASAPPPPSVLLEHPLRVAPP